MEAAEGPIGRILSEAQFCSTAMHPRLIKELVHLRRENADFLEDWCTCLQPFFLVAARKPAVEKAVRFCAQFVAFRDADGEDCDFFAEEFLGVLLEWAEAVDKTVRFRACQMVHEIMERIHEDAMLRDEAVDAVVESMLQRMEDRVAAVRVFAARSVSRLLVATDKEQLEESGILVQYRQTLAFDENAEVRRWIVMSIPPLNSTVSDIVERTADMSDLVRKAAFYKLKRDFPVSSLSIMQRASVLQRGLADRVPAVKLECLAMLKNSWFTRDCQGNVLTLLKFIDVETNGRVAETVLAELLRAGVLGVGCKDIPLLAVDTHRELLEAEEAIYWRMVATSLSADRQARSSEAAISIGQQALVIAEDAASKEAALDKLLPSSIGEYLELLERHLLAGPQYRFSCLQLLKLGTVIDYSDSVSRKVAAGFLWRLLDGTDFCGDPEQIVGDGLSIGGCKDWEDGITSFGSAVHAATGEWIRVLVESVADQGRPCREGGADVVKWLQCLALAGLLLQNLKSTNQLRGSSMEASELADALLTSAVNHIHPEVQCAGIRCAGLLCQLEPSSKLAQALLLALSSPHQPVRNMAVKATFDLIMCHGAKFVERIPDASEIEHMKKPVMQILASWLEEAEEPIEDPVVEVDSTKTLVAQGFCKLLIASKAVFEESHRDIQDTILQRLLLLYFKCETASPRLKQFLSLFFQNYTAVSTEHKLCLARVFVRVVRCTWLENAEAASVVAKQRSTDVSRFMLSLMLQNCKKPAERSVDNSPEGSGEVDHGAPDEGHEDLALRIANEVQNTYKQSKFPAAKLYVGILYKSAFSLTFRPIEQERIKCMYHLVDRSIDLFSKDKLIARKLIQEIQVFKMRLRALDATPDSGLNSEQLSILMEGLKLNAQSNEEEGVTRTHTSCSTRKKKSTNKSRNRKKSPVESETSSPEIYTPAPRRRRGRGELSKSLEYPAT